MQIGNICDIGRKRTLNEDCILCINLSITSNSIAETSGLFVVADGMGGHKAGEIASRLATREMARQCLSGLPELTSEETGITPAIQNPGSMVELAVGIANKTIYDVSVNDSSLQGMGTTIVAALITGQDLFVTSAGDSRCYIINENEIVQVTKDHSLAQEMLDVGLIAPEEVRTHPRKNVLTHVLGYEEKVEADSFNRKLYEGDYVLLCSDGLWGVLTDHQIKETVLKAVSPQQACVELVAQANDMGGPDNISVIIIRPESLPIRQEVLEAETQVLAVSGRASAPMQKERKGFFSLFGRKKSID